MSGWGHTDTMISLWLRSLYKKGGRGPGPPSILSTLTSLEKNLGVNSGKTNFGPFAKKDRGGGPKFVFPELAESDHF